MGAADPQYARLPRDPALFRKSGAFVLHFAIGCIGTK